MKSSILFIFSQKQQQEIMGKYVFLCEGFGIDFPE